MSGRSIAVVSTGSTFSVGLFFVLFFSILQIEDE